MTKVICFENDAGFASIIVAAPELFDPESHTRQDLLAAGIEFANDDEVLDWVAKKDVPNGKQYTIIDSANIPMDRTYRNAWKINTDKLEVNLDMAKPLQQDIIRVMRVDKFDKADIDFNKAVEKVLDKLIVSLPGDPDAAALKAIMDKRQALRDAPAINLDDVQSVEDLKKKIPDVVKAS